MAQQQRGLTSSAAVARRPARRARRLRHRDPGRGPPRRGCLGQPGPAGPRCLLRRGRASEAGAPLWETVETRRSRRGPGRQPAPLPRRRARPHTADRVSFDHGVRTKRPVVGGIDRSGGSRASASSRCGVPGRPATERSATSSRSPRDERGQARSTAMRARRRAGSGPSSTRRATTSPSPGRGGRNSATRPTPPCVPPSAGATGLLHRFHLGGPDVEVVYRTLTETGRLVGAFRLPAATLNARRSRFPTSCWPAASCSASASASRWSASSAATWPSAGGRAARFALALRSSEAAGAVAAEGRRNSAPCDGIRWRRP